MGWPNSRSPGCWSPGRLASWPHEWQDNVVHKPSPSFANGINQLVENAFLVLAVVTARLIWRGVIARDFMWAGRALISATGVVGAAGKQAGHHPKRKKSLFHCQSHAWVHADWTFHQHKRHIVACRARASLPQQRTHVHTMRHPQNNPGNIDFNPRKVCQGQLYWAAYPFSGRGTR